jgi:hypothetical protein
MHSQLAHIAERHRRAGRVLGFGGHDASLPCHARLARLSGRWSVQAYDGRGRCATPAKNSWSCPAPSADRDARAPLLPAAVDHRGQERRVFHRARSQRRCGGIRVLRERARPRGQRPICSRATRRGASRSTSPRCRNWCRSLKGPNKWTQLNRVFRIAAPGRA